MHPKRDTYELTTFAASKKKNMRVVSRNLALALLNATLQPCYYYMPSLTLACVHDHPKIQL